MFRRDGLFVREHGGHWFVAWDDLAGVTAVRAASTLAIELRDGSAREFSVRAFGANAHDLAREIHRLQMRARWDDYQRGSIGRRMSAPDSPE